MRETLSFLAWTLVATYGLVHYRYRIQALGAFTVPLVAVLTFIALLEREAVGAASGAVTNTGASWLFPVHTTMLLFAYASFFVAFVASVMYLLQERELKLKTFSAIFHRLPSLQRHRDERGGHRFNFTDARHLYRNALVFDARRTRLA